MSFSIQLKSVALAGASIAVAGALSACTVAAPPPSGGDGRDANCDAIAAGLMTGAPVIENPDGSVTVGASTIPADQQIRIYEQGSPVTQDFRPDRLNLETDASGNLVRAHCV